MNEHQQRIAAECDRLKDLLLAKNADYGASVYEPSALVGVSNGDGILLRLEDKWRRLKTIARLTGDPEINESFGETLIDLAGYAILYLARP